jgi:hypothetical protein
MKLSTMQYLKVIKTNHYNEWIGDKQHTGIEN